MSEEGLKEKIARNISVEIDTKRTEALSAENALLKKQLEEQAEKAEDLENKLAFVAEKEKIRRTNALEARISNLISDPDKRKEMIEKVKSNPNNINAMEQTMTLLEEQLSQNRKIQIPSGVAPLNAQQFGNSETRDLAHRKFASVEEAYRTLKVIQKTSNDPAEIAEAKRLADLMFAKGLKDYIGAGHPTGRFSEDDKVQKVIQGDPQLNLNDAKESFSELARFGIKKTPFDYACKNRVITINKEGET